MPKQQKQHTTTTLAQYLIYAARFGKVTSAFIYGDQGAGKTTYTLQSLYYVYRNWNKVIRHTYFDLEDLEADLDEARREHRRLKAILLDDISIMLDKYQWRDKKIQAFNKIFNLIRTECAGVIFTSVMFKDITNYFRERIKYRVHIINTKPLWSIAKGYVRSITPRMQEIIKPLWKDRFPLVLPPEVRRYYEVKRDEALAWAHEQFREAAKRDSIVRKRKKEPKPTISNADDLLSDEELFKLLKENNLV